MGHGAGSRNDVGQSVKPLPNRSELIELLKPHGQEHLLRFWDEVDNAGRQRLARQIEGVDLAQIAALYGEQSATHDWAAMARRATPPKAVRMADRTGKAAAEAKRRGEEALAAGKVGVLLVAGGQGSRLGFDHAKGLFPIGPISQASLLQIHLEKTLAASRRYGAPVPLYMMTSPVTHDEQTAFLKEHRNFGMPVDDVVLFRQGTMPAVDAATGKLLLAEKDSLFLSPDGHGGTVAALAASGAIEDMRRRGIEHLFYLQVDNPLTPICDAEFIGDHLISKSDYSSVATAKQTPQDRLGNFAVIDGQMNMIEYSDMPDDVAERRDANGQLVFWAGSVAIHMFRVAFLERILALKDALPFHVARKKVPHIDEAGKTINPKEPNALKFERFIFDLLPHAKNPLVVEYAEEEVFAPVKNAPGASRDTPEYVQRFMSLQHRNWLEAAGTRVADGVAVEISPLWGMDAEGVAARKDRPQSIDRPTYLAD
jgi:UDP-N-acetylglucosamine/UDP-N-acetylgalactosamine diphosphorylase